MKLTNIRQLMRRDRVSCLVVLLIETVLSFSCSLYPTVMVQPMRLPSFPEAWAGAECWEIRWETETGYLGRVFARADSVVSLELPVHGSAVVFARAMFGNNATKPFGFVWPGPRDSEGFLVPSAVGGWCASLAAPLLRAGWKLSSFNWNRLAEELASLEDPWDLEPENLSAIVAAGKFRSDYLSAPGLKVEIALSGIDRVLSPASPWAGKLVPDSGGLVRARVTPGNRAWISVGSRLRLSVSPTGVVCSSYSAAD